MSLFKYLFKKKEKDIVDNILPKCGKTYLHIDNVSGIPYFTNESPELKRWCEAQLNKNMRNRL